MSNVKFCKDCRFFTPNMTEKFVRGGFFSFGRWEPRPDLSGKYAKCARTDLVGAGGQEGHHCSSERQFNWAGYCGTNARFFEPKTESVTTEHGTALFPK